LRAGVLAPSLIAVLVGASLVAGLIAALANLTNLRFLTSQVAGRLFYGWVVGIELIVLALGGFAHVWHRVVDDRKSGLWESNRVTTLSAPDLLVGYWLGAPLREAIMGAILAFAGLAIVVLSGLPLLLWVMTQLVIASTVVLLWLLAIVVGLSLERAIVPIALVFLLLALQGISLAAPQLTLTSFVVPLTTIARFFDSAPSNETATHPILFGVAIHPLILTWLVQLVLGLVLWRGAARNVKNPFGAFLSRGETAACFAALVGLQHGLIWAGKGSTETATAYFNFPRPVCLITSNHDVLVLVVTHGATLALAILMLTLLSPVPERIRVAALREGAGGFRIVYSRSMVSMGLGLTGIVALAFLTHVPHCLGEPFQTLLLVVLMNTAAVLVIVPALLDLCRLLFRHRSTGFFALGLFTLFLLPYVLAGVFSNTDIARWGLLSPGVLVLSEPLHDPTVSLVISTVHLAFAGAVLLAWQQAWLRLLKGTLRQGLRQGG
jgi:hypothetical protein